MRCEILGESLRRALGRRAGRVRVRGPGPRDRWREDDEGGLRVLVSKKMGEK